MLSITESELREIAEITNVVPQEYRQKCFELLLSHTLQSTFSNVSPLQNPIPPTSSADIDRQAFIVPIDVKAFLSQYGLNESMLWQCFHTEGKDIRPIYRLKTEKKAKAQIEIALMIALESALTTGQFQITIDNLRQRCKEQNSYDGPNFAKTLKAYSHLFNSSADNELLTLTPDGKNELAELLESLKG